MDFVLVGVVNATNLRAIRRNRARNNTLGASFEFVALDLFTSTGIPEEHDRGIIDLASESSRTVGTDGNAHDIVGMLVIIICL